MAGRPSAEAWWRAARTLGFELRDDGNGNALTPVWDSMHRSLRPHTSLSEHNWMVGTVDGAPALVTYYFRDGGSSSDTHYTHALVQLDPPLFLGLHLDRRTWLSGIPRLGVPLFDDKLTVRAFQPERGAAIVWPGRPPLVAEPALEAVARGMTPQLYDSFAVLTVPRFESDPLVLREMLHRAGALARAAKERRRAIGESREEAAVREAWTRFAERERLGFDHERRALHGSYQGVPAHVLTWSTPFTMSSQVSVELPIDPGMQVTVTKETGLTRFGNVIGFSDIEIGDAAFDHELRVKGGPVHLVRPFFAPPALRALTPSLVSRYGQLCVEGRFVSLGMPYARSEAELAAVLGDLVVFARAASPAAPPPQGPYRA